MIDGPEKGRICEIWQDSIPNGILIDDIHYHITRVSLFGRQINVGHACPMEELNDVGFNYFAREELKASIERESRRGQESETNEVRDQAGQ